MLTLILLYALGANVVEKPDGIAISAAFIAGVVVVLLISRVTRTTELRVDRIEFDEAARRFVADPSTFSNVLHVRGLEIADHRILRAEAPAAPNAIAATLLALRDATGLRPRCHFEWSEGNPIGHLFRYLILGQGDTPPVVREIIRQHEPDPAKRPGIHVGG